MDGRRAATATLFLALCLIISGAGCGKKEGQSPQGSPTVPEQSRREYHRRDPPRIPCRFRPAGGSRSLWCPLHRAGSLRRPFPSSRPRNTGPKSFSSDGSSMGGNRKAVRSFRHSRFQRGDRIRANVKLRAGGRGDASRYAGSCRGQRVAGRHGRADRTPRTILGEHGSGGRPGSGPGRGSVDIQVPMARQRFPRCRRTANR